MKIMKYRNLAADNWYTVFKEPTDLFDPIEE